MCCASQFNVYSGLLTRGLMVGVVLGLRYGRHHPNEYKATEIFLSTWSLGDIHADYMPWDSLLISSSKNIYRRGIATHKNI